MNSQGAQKAVPRIEHPKDDPSPQTVEAIKPVKKTNPPGSKSSGPAKPAKAPVPKPLTPREKIYAITPEKAQTSTGAGNKATNPKLTVGLTKPGGCLPINHRASKAPAKQELELRHGLSSLRNVAVN